jgi:hypothetical protein
MAAFAYASLWKRMQRFPVTDDIVVTVLTADYPAMKHQRGRCVPFLTRNMTARRVTEASLCDFPLYEHGMFVVYEADALLAAPPDRALRKKQLFVVFPKRAGEVFVGNHFTFMVNPKAPEPERLQFHLTRYGRMEDGVELDVKHAKNNMPLRFSLPSDPRYFKEKLLTRPDIRQDAFAVPLHALLTEGTRAYRPQQAGGSKRRGQHRARQTAARRGRRPAAFDELWYELPLHAITIVGVRASEGYDVSVTVADRLNHRGADDNVLRPACTFRSPTMELGMVTALIAEYAASAAWTWDTFTIPEEDV